jgi:hypothetical protein
MEQLFKHEGMCVWTDEEYAFMKGARKVWPSGCSATGATAADGGSLYYDIRPLQNGRIAVGLYTDPECVTEYPADADTIEGVVGNLFVDGGSSGGSGDDGTYDFSGDTFAEGLERWDAAFDVWHTCHPCVAHDLENTGGDKYTDDDDNGYNNGYYYYYYNGNRKRGRDRRGLGGEYSAQGDVFECYDDAGYTNVNQVRRTRQCHGSGSSLGGRGFAYYAHRTFSPPLECMSWDVLHTDIPPRQWRTDGRTIVSNSA